MKYISILSTLFALLIFPFSDSLAAPGDTPDKKFNFWKATYVITEVPTGAEKLLGVAISTRSDETVLYKDRVAVASIDFVGTPKLQTKLQAVYSDINSSYHDVLGSKVAGLDVIQIPGNAFDQVRILIEPTGLPKFVVKASRERKELIGSTFVNKLRLKGKKKAGAKFKVTATGINRGRDVTTPGDMTLTLVLGKPVNPVTVIKKNNVSGACTIKYRSVFTVVNCPIGFLGPKAKKVKGKKSGSFTVRFKIPENLGGEELQVATQIARTDTRLDVQSSKTKSITLKIGEAGGSSPSGDSLLGVFKRSFPSFGGDPISKYRFKKEGSVINGYVTKLSGRDEGLGLKIGDKVFRNFRKSGNSFEGEILFQVKSDGSFSFSDITLTIQGDSVVNQFGQTILFR